MAKPVQPYSRAEFNRALITHAMLSPFNVLILAGMLAAGVLIDVFLVVLPVAVVLYGIAAARTYFDHDEAQKVLERERRKRRRALERERINLATLAPPIRAMLEGARQRELRIREAIERARLPYTEVSEEVDRFIRAMETTAARAQLLYEALSETPPPVVEQRLRQVKLDPSKAELADAVGRQLQVLRRMEGQLQRFFDELERIVVELDTVRGSLVSVSASTEAANQQRLAGEVRALREDVGALAEGMSEAYERPELPTG